jgi:hypothetical protein
MTNVRKYWRLAPAALPASSSVFEDPVLTGPVELLARLSSRDGIVLGAWDAGALLGRVSTLGVVTKVAGTTAEVDWREVDVTLRPNPAGRTHWARKQYFAFAKDVVARYMLADLFAERFPDMENIAFAPNARAAAVARRLPTVAIPGYVYVIRSEYGYKIGKTVNLKTRTRLFEVRLPFPITLEHYAWFEDYSAAERDFHEMFRDKRKEGEWFDLDAADLKRIRGFGKAVPPEALG